jgi:large subunit ribosomal protein L13
MKTYSAKPTDVSKKWHIIDASQATLGRVSTIIVDLLMGKSKAQFTHHIDCGDFVIVINSDQLKVTGKKISNKIYYRHSGFPGGIKQATLSETIQKDSTDVIYKAVKGMLPVNKLRKDRLARLKIYKDENHQHNAQKPVEFKIKGQK